MTQKLLFFLYFSYIYDCFENVDFPFGELNNVSVCVQMGTASWNAQKKKNYCFHAKERQKSKNMQKMFHDLHEFSCQCALIRCSIIISLLQL